MKTRLNMVLAVAGTVGALLTGCGYHIGFVGHPQIKSIAVAPAVNETAVYNTASDIRMMMCESIMQDGTYELADQSNADCVLFLTVQSASFADVSGDTYDKENTYIPKEWSASVTVDYKLIIPGQGTVLLKGSASGSSRFQAPLDVETSRLRAVRQACFEAAEKITWAISEGW